MFQECFNEILFDEVVVAWISSQLPEQKEGLFFSVCHECYGGHFVKFRALYMKMNYQKKFEIV